MFIIQATGLSYALTPAALDLKGHLPGLSWTKWRGIVDRIVHFCWDSLVSEFCRKKLDGWRKKDRWRNWMLSKSQDGYDLVRDWITSERGERGESGRKEREKEYLSVSQDGSNLIRNRISCISERESLHCKTLICRNRCLVIICWCILPTFWSKSNICPIMEPK